MQTNYLIYKATSPTNKSYIGYTKNLAKRQRGHRNQASTGYDCAFSRAIRKYGFSSFAWEVLLEGLTFEEAKNAERRLIKEHNTFHKGYNETGGGEGSLKRLVSAETRKRISEANKGYERSASYKKACSKRYRGKGNPRFGKPVSEHTRALIRQANKGRKCSEQTREKIAKAMRERKLSPEHKERIRTALKKYHANL